ASWRALKPSGASWASSTAISGGRTALTDRRSGTGPSYDATWPNACTPASVRPATVRSTSRRSTVCSALTTSAATVRRPGCCAQPAKGPPSYSSLSLDQLEVHHLGRVRRARAQLEDPRVAAGALGVARGDLLEELVDDALRGVLEDRDRLPAGVQVALARQRDQLLELRLDRLRLGLGGLDPLVVDDLDAEVGEQ